MMALITICAVAIMVTWIGCGIRRAAQTRARIERLRNAERRERDRQPTTYPTSR